MRFVSGPFCEYSAFHRLFPRIALIMPRPRMNVGFALLIAFACHTAMAQSDQRAHALDAIVGEWQSDTTGGTSARTTCGWTPAKLSVICEQLLDTRRGIQRVQNFYTFDAATGRYFFYGPLKPG